MEEQQRLERRDLQAALEARAHLGQGYDVELAESFLARIEKDIEARVDRQVAERLQGERVQTGSDHRARGQSLALGIVSVTLSIPLMAIEGALLGGEALPAIGITWAGIAAVNWAFSRRR